MPVISNRLPWDNTKLFKSRGRNHIKIETKIGKATFSKRYTNLSKESRNVRHVQHQSVESKHYDQKTD